MTRWLVGWLRLLRRALRRVDYFLARRFALSTREDRIFFVSIPAVGVAAGLLGVLVHRAIDFVRTALWGYWPDLIHAVERLSALHVLLATGAGGVAVALIVWWAREPVSGRGMSSLIEAVALHEGRVPLRTTALSALQDFYTQVLGLQPGPRPNFSFDGAWLYCGDRATVHLVAVETAPGTGAHLTLQHFAFAATDLDGFLRRLTEHAVPYQLGFRLDFGLCQVKLRDPDGNQLHVDFPLDEARALGLVSESSI